MACCCNKTRRRWPFYVILAVVSALLLFVWMADAKGQVTAPDTAAAVTNPMCPVLTDEAVDPGQFIDYEGRRVYFCCAKCKRMFERDPGAYLANLPLSAETSPADQGPATPDHHTSEPGQTHDLAVDGPTDQGYLRTSGQAVHDHAAHDQKAEKGGLNKLIAWLGNFHPPATDFPAALILAALLAEALYIATGRPMFDAAGRFTVWLAVLGTLGAVTLGWFFAGFKLSDGDWIMTTHRWVGSAAGLWAMPLAWLAHKAWQQAPADNPSRWRLRYRLALVVAVVLVSTNGFLGGAMVYGLDHYAW